MTNAPKAASRKKGTTTIVWLCVRHDRHWPCRKLEPKDSNHDWVYLTTRTTYGERNV